MVATWLWYGCDLREKCRLSRQIDTFTLEKLCHLFTASQNNTLRKIATAL